MNFLLIKIYWCFDRRISFTDKIMSPLTEVGQLCRQITIRKQKLLKEQLIIIFTHDIGCFRAMKNSGTKKCGENFNRKKNCDRKI